MLIAARAFQSGRATLNNTSRPTNYEKPQRFLAATLCVAALLFTGCGETAKPVTAPSAGKVDSYFGSAFVVPGTALGKSSTTFDHSARQVAVSSFLTNQTAQVPTQLINGTFATADTGFLGITENFAPNNSGIISPQNPPLSGAWAVEIPGAGALANVLHVVGSGAVAAAPAA